MSGKELFIELVTGTNLPEEPLVRELSRLLEKASISQEDCSLEHLRDILAEYAQEILLEAKTAHAK